MPGRDATGTAGSDTAACDVPRGRPRDAGRDAAIQAATLHLLVEVGYEQLSIEAVADRAGVGKTTIYRRHPNKAAMVTAALDQRTPAVPPDTRADDLRTGLLRTLRWLTDQIAEQEIGLVGAIFAGMRSDPELATRMRAILRRDVAAMTDHPLGAGAGHGERLTGQATDLFTEIAPAVIVHRLLMTGQPCAPTFLEHLVDDILLPLLREH